MIDFSLSEEEELVRNSAREFAERRLRPAARAHEQDGVPDALVDEARSLGLLGGQEQLAPLVHALVLEELAAVDAAAALALDLGGLTRALCSEDPARLALAVDAGEQLSFDPKDAPRPQLTSEKCRIHGEVPLAIGHAPDKALVLRGDHALFIHELSHKQPTPALALHAAGTWSLRFDGAAAVELAPDHAMASALARVRLGQAAIFVGLARAAWEYASRYAQERIAFGKPIAQHQAVAFMLVEMAMAADLARLATWRAAHDIAVESERATFAARAALAEAAGAAQMATERAVQLLGGHGYLKDHPVEKWMREARMLALVWNTDEEE